MHHLRGEPRSEQDASAEDSIRSPGGGGGGWAVWKEKDSREEEATAFELKDCAPLSLSLSLSLSLCSPDFCARKLRVLLLPPRGLEAGL
jgi:hypothetical protein